MQSVYKLRTRSDILLQDAKKLQFDAIASKLTRGIDLA